MSAGGEAGLAQPGSSDRGLSRWPPHPHTPALEVTWTNTVVVEPVFLKCSHFVIWKTIVTKINA